MKKVILSTLSFSCIFIIFVAGLVYYSPHFFIKHLLKDTVRDLQDSGVMISLVEPEPRKTALHLSIPSVGIKDLLLEPKLVVSHFFPPSLDVLIEKSLTDFSLGGLKFKTFRAKVLGRKLLSNLLEIDLNLSGTLSSTQPVAFDLTAQSYELSDKNIVFKGAISIDEKNFTLKGPFDFIWDLKKSLPSITVDAITHVLKVPGSLKAVLLEGPSGPQIKLDLLGLSHPSVLSHLKFDLHSQVDFLKNKGLVLIGHLNEKNTPLKISLKGSCDPLLNTCELSYKLPIRFNEHFSPDKIFPPLVKKVAGFEGAIDLNGRFQKKNDSTDADLKISVQNLSGYVFETPFINLNTSVDLTFLPTLKSRKQSFIRIEKIGENLSLENLKGKFSIGSRFIKIDEMGADLKGGNIGLKPTTIPFKDFAGSYLVTVTNLDLAKFLISLKSPRLSGEGRLNGKFPMRYREGQLFIDQAVLINQGPGKIRYLDPSIGDVKEKIEYLADFNDLLARGQQALAYKALSDFRYSVLELRASRSSSERLSVALHLKGKNPDLAKGQPFEINLPISGNLESFLIESLLKSSMESDE